MKFCIITDVSLDIPNGIASYVRNLKESFKLTDKDIFNVFNLTNEDISYINENYSFVSLQIGILRSKTADGFKIQKLKKIKLKKIATIHSVVDEEVRLYKECMDTYFPTVEYPIGTVHGSSYEKFFLKLVDGLVFSTIEDFNIFKKYYNTSVRSKIIPPSVDYIQKSKYLSPLKKSNNAAFLGRVDYRKGILASLNSMEFLPELNYNIFGPVDTDNQHNKVILNHFKSKYKNIVYRGNVNNRQEYYDSHFIFFGNSLYEPFGFSHIENLFNNVVPIIGKGTGTHEVFGNEYPFVVEDSVTDLVNIVKLIYSKDINYIQAILDKAKNNLRHLTDTFFELNYLDYFNSFNT